MTVQAGDLVLVDEVHSGRSYQSDFGRRLHFGLGSRAAVERLQVKWVGGKTDIVQVPGVDRLILIEEGRRLVAGPNAPTPK